MLMPSSEVQGSVLYSYFDIETSMQENCLGHIGHMNSKVNQLDLNLEALNKMCS